MGLSLNYGRFEKTSPIWRECMITVSSLQSLWHQQRPACDHYSQRTVKFHSTVTLALFQLLHTELDRTTIGVSICSCAVSSQETMIEHGSQAVFSRFDSVSFFLSWDALLSSICRSWHICSKFVWTMRLYEEAEEEMADKQHSVGCCLLEVAISHSVSVVGLLFT